MFRDDTAGMSDRNTVLCLRYPGPWKSRHGPDNACILYDADGVPIAVLRSLCMETSAEDLARLCINGLEALRCRALGGNDQADEHY